jgi:hypothetical protein
MTLNRQVISIPFTQGVDQKTSRNVIPLGKMSLLENAIFQQPGALRKRFGYESLSTLISNPVDPLAPDILAGKILTTLKDELILGDGERIYSYNSGIQQWTDKGRLTIGHVGQAPIVRDSYTQIRPDGNVHSSGNALFAWEDSQGGVRYAIRDTTTGQMIVGSTLLDALGNCPKVMVVGNYFVILYVQNNGLKILNMAVLPVYQPTSTPAISNVTSAVSGSGQYELNQTTNTYDAVVIGGVLYVTVNNAAPGVSVMRFNSVTLVPDVIVYIAAVTTDTINIFEDPATAAPVLAYYIGPGAVLHWVAYDADLNILHSNTVSPVGSVITMSGVGSDTAGSWRIALSTFGYDGFKFYVDTTQVVISAYGAGIVQPLSGQVVLTGKGFRQGNHSYWNTVSFGRIDGVDFKTIQTTYFLMDESGHVIMRALSGLGASSPTAGLGSRLPCTLLSESARSDASVVLPVLVKDFLTTFPGTTTVGTPNTATFTQTGVTSLTFNFDDAISTGTTAQLGGSLFFDGGILTQYDGISPVEAGFNLFPELFTTDLVSSNVGGSLGDATFATSYWYAVTYEWTDANGIIQRSAPSIPLSVDFAPGTVTGSVVLHLPMLRVTQKRDPRTPVLIQVYRTVGIAPNVFYSVNTTQVPAAVPTDQPGLNDPDGTDIIFTDTISDADIIGNPHLYTTGGVLENIPTPPVASLTVYQNRLWGIDTTNPTSLWFSQQVLPGTYPEFSDFLTQNVDPRIGSTTGVITLDEKLLLFGPDKIFATTGQGPDQTGANNTYQDPQQVSAESGCPYPRSLVLTQEGIIGQSLKGIFLTNRGLASSYLGADVERLVEGHIATSSRVIPSTTQIRFTLNDGRSIVYDTLVRQWGIFTPISAVDSIIWREQFSWLDAAGVVHVETPAVYADAGQPIRLNLKTSPIRLSGLAGFERAKELVILGEYLSPCTLEVSVYFDGNTAPEQVVIVTPQDPLLWGEDSVWGGSSPFGGAWVPGLWRVFLNKQKCSSIQIGVRELDTGTPGQGVSLNGFSVEIGTKQGAYKLPASASYGG